jgi:phosphonate transport system permease protein
MTTEGAPRPLPAGIGGVAPRRLAIWTLIGAALVALFVHAWIDVGASVSEFISGYHGMANIIGRSWPPSTSVLRSSVSDSIVTFDTALLGTAGAIVLSILLVPFAARNITPHRVAYELSRALIAITRGVPDLIWALIFVTAVGLGPFPGVLALTVHSVGILGKLWAEAIEEMDMGPVDALRVAGANRFQVFVHAVLPGVAPSLIGLTLYRFDVNFRSGLVLGFVGAGGIGFLIYNSMQLFQYQQVLTELGVVIVFVLVLERFSTVLRSRIH